MKNLLRIIVLLIVICACKSTPVVTKLPDADSYRIEVIPAKVESEPTFTETKEEEQPSLFIEVPPSTQVTHIEIKPKKGIKQKVKETFTNTSKFDVKSDNPNIKPTQPKKVVWWRWVVAIILGLFILSATIMSLVNRFTNINPFRWFRK